MTSNKCSIGISCYDSDSDLDLFLVQSLSSVWELAHTS